MSRLRASDPVETRPGEMDDGPARRHGCRRSVAVGEGGSQASRIIIRPYAVVGWVCASARAPPAEPHNGAPLLCQIGPNIVIDWAGFDQSAAWYI